MAQTKKKRRRKHSGTQAGTVQRRPASDKRPETKEERREAARRRREERLDRKPTLRSSVARAAIAAVIFMAFVVVALQLPIVRALPIGLLMLVLYIPLGYFMDLFIYRRRQRKRERAGEATDGGRSGTGRGRRPRGER